MIKTTADSISIRTSLRFEECLRLLRQKLQREQFLIVTQIELHREFKKTLGLSWRKQVVLIIWNAFYAYQGLLCGEAAGLSVAFNISVSDHADSTLITPLNHSRKNVTGEGAIGHDILKRELNRKMEQILMEFASRETTAVSAVILEASKQSI